MICNAGLVGLQWLGRAAEQYNASTFSPVLDCLRSFAMNTAVRCLGYSLVLVLLTGSRLSAQDAPKTPKLEGVWLGTLKVDDQELRLGFTVTTKDGKLHATLNSIDQAADGIPIKEVTIQDGTVRFALPAIKASFEGKFNKEATEIAGEWKQGAAYPLTLKRVDKLPTVQKQDSSKLEGVWLGTLKGKTDLRLGFSVVATPGKLTATMSSVDQGVDGIAVKEVIERDGTVRFELPSIKATFEGKMNKEGTEIVGEWKQGTTLPLTLKRVSKLPTAKRPQEPKRPFPYREEEITYENKKAKVKFAGTLTLPKGDGPFPAVVMITGSGPQNRDEELLGHKPFLVISDYLTRRGIAVVRVDDRGVGGSTGDNNSSTSADFAEDALAGVAFLKSRKEIDAQHIGLIGHSEGGLVGPLAASMSRDVAFVVMLAGPGLPGDEILIEQNKLILKAGGASQDAIDRQLKWLAMALPIVKLEQDSKVAEKRIRAELAKWKEAAGEKDKAMADFISTREKAVGTLTTQWFRYFLSYDPRPALRKVQCPVLALNGEKDLQVPCKDNLDAVAKALKEGGNKDYTVREFASLNHLFQTCKTGGVEEYGAIEETIAPVVLETMGDWILARVK
jgi:pimeloyl-ACP methyl ester carboxylesterase